MGFSPRRSLFHRKLYRNWMFAVTLAALIGPASSLVAQDLMTQYGRKAPADKGPRALGLVQISPKGKKARLIPIAIMLDGKFYDAGSYKASPVPLALDFGIVYEGFRSGVSEGIFTITQPGQLNHTWIAEGTWIPAGERVPEKHKKYSPPVIADDDKEGPPVLHRRVEKSDSDSNSGNSSESNGKDNKDNKDNKDQQKPAASPSTPPAATPPASNAPDAAKVPAASEPAKTTASASSPSASSTEGSMQDPNRPRLRRGKPDTSEQHEPFATFEALPGATPAPGTAGTGKSDVKVAKVADTSVPQIVTVPAISDAGGPDPRPYKYDVKPAEEAIYRNKMLDLATTQVLAQASAAAKAASPQKSSSTSTRTASRSTSKLPKPAFDDVTLRIFDLSNSNEPVLVLSAKTRPAASGSSQEPKEITLIARTNLEGELRKLFFSQTDSRHLDITPRMELIDAVDADGDGRGELLFRRTYDSGSAYAIYRVTADGLWPLFEGTP